MTRADVVFPVPGGPSKSTARGRLEANWRRVPLAISLYTSACGCRSAHVNLVMGRVKAAAVSGYCCARQKWEESSVPAAQARPGALPRTRVQQRQQHSVLDLPLLLLVPGQDALQAAGSGGRCTRV